MGNVGAGDTPEKKDGIVKKENHEIAASFEFDAGLGLVKLKEVAQEIIDSGLCPKNMTEPGQLIAVGQMGKELGFSWMSAINNIDNIQGKPTLSYRAVGALLHMKGYGVNWPQDATDILDTSGNVVEWVTEVEIVDYNLLEKYKKELATILTYPEDVRAMFLGTLEELKSQIKRRMTYKWSDAHKAGYTEKSQWMRMPREMLRARCLVGAVRAFCPHVMMGLYETTEIDNTQPLRDEGTVTFIDAEYED